MVVERTLYKDNLVINIKKNEKDTRPFMFGLEKAKKVIGAIEEIKAFIADAEKQAVIKKENQTVAKKQSKIEKLESQLAELKPS